MSVPPGASSVTYSFGQQPVSTDPPWTVTVTVDLSTTNDPDLVDRTTADAMVALSKTISESYNPLNTTSMQRAYDCSVPGDPWPAQ